VLSTLECQLDTVLRHGLAHVQYITAGEFYMIK